MDHTKNTEIFERACQSIAGGQLTNFKQGKGAQPVYAQKVEGAKITDYDGNVYRDFALTFGPAILGQSNERYRQALIDALQDRYTCEFSTLPIEAAEKIKECIPGMEILRFGVTGSEANYQAIRVARAYTGKDMYVKFNGHFHGGPDYIVGGYVEDPANPKVTIGADERDPWAKMCNTKGRAAHAFDDAYMIEYNDLDALRTLFEKDGDNIAAVVMEPFPVNCNGCEALPGYMQGVRGLCDKHNVVMIFDEILTGFRIGIGGAAAYYGVAPDLWTFSKAIAAGFPVSVYGGKAKVMECVVDCSALAPGTFNGHHVAMAAIINVLTQLQENDGEIFKRIAKLHERLKEGFLENAKKHEIDFIVQGFPGALVPVFTKKDRIINNADALDHASVPNSFLFSGLMKQEGILNNIRYCIGAGHTEEDIEFAIQASDNAFKNLAAVLKSQMDVNELIK